MAQHPALVNSLRRGSNNAQQHTGGPPPPLLGPRHRSPRRCRRCRRRSHSCRRGPAFHPGVPLHREGGLRSAVAQLLPGLGWGRTTPSVMHNSQQECGRHHGGRGGAPGQGPSGLLGRGTARHTPRGQSQGRRSWRPPGQGCASGQCPWQTAPEGSTVDPDIIRYGPTMVRYLGGGSGPHLRTPPTYNQISFGAFGAGWVTFFLSFLEHALSNGVIPSPPPVKEERNGGTPTIPAMTPSLY